VFGLYAITLAPTAGFWDASEYIATAHILGIPHPPGNPLFIVLARTWEVLLEPLRLAPAVRINLFAAVTSAASAGFLYLIAHRLWIGAIGGVSGKRSGHVAAGLAALVSATSYTVWNQSTVNEKVYTLSLLVVSAVLWLGLRWYDRRDEPGSEKLLLLGIYLAFLGATSHLMSLLALPGLAVLVVIGRSRHRAFTGAALWLGAASVPLICLALSFNLFLPIRAEERPAMNDADRLSASVSAAAVTAVTFGRSSACPALAAVLTREQYGKPPVTDRQAPWEAQFGMYAQYFDWQWARGWDPSELPSPYRAYASLVAVMLALLGLGVAFRAGAGPGALLASTVFTVTVGLVVYLNFRHGYSLGAGSVDMLQREVRERDYFFLVSFQLWGLLAGLGITAVWWAAAGRLPGSHQALLASPILLVAFIPLVSNWQWADRSGDYAARDWG